MLGLFADHAQRNGASPKLAGLKVALHRVPSCGGGRRPSRRIRETGGVAFQDSSFLTDLVDFNCNCAMYDLIDGMVDPGAFSGSEMAVIALSAMAGVTRLTAEGPLDGPRHVRSSPSEIGSSSSIISMPASGEFRIPTDYGKRSDLTPAVAESGLNLSRFFERLVFDSGLPTVPYSTEIGTDEVTVRFEQPGAVYDVPVTVTVQYADGRVHEEVFVLREATAEFRIPVRGPVRSVDINQDHATLALFERGR